MAQRYQLSYINWPDKSTSSFDIQFDYFEAVQEFVNSFDREYTSFQVIVVRV